MPETDRWIELAKVSLASFQNRRAYEWKLTCGFWFGIGASSAGCRLLGCNSIEWFPAFLFTSYAVFAFVYLLLWKVTIHSAHARDRALFNYFMEKAQGFDVEAPTDPIGPTKLIRRMTVHNWIWLIGQILVTVTGLLLAWIAATHDAGIPYENAVEFMK